MSEDELVAVGRVGRPHGIDGSFFVDDASESADRFARGARLYAAGEPVEVVGSKHGAGGRIVIKLDRDVPRDTMLAVPRSALPAPEADAYYVFQLVGLEVVEEGGRVLGTVTEVHNGPANDALELDSGLLLPLVGACIEDVDLAAGRVVVAPGFADDE